MLSPSYLLQATEPAEEIAEKLHIDIVNRIVERIVLRFQRGDDYTLTSLDKWQLETLQQAGLLLGDIQKEIASATGMMVSEMAAAMEDAGVKALDYDDNIYREAGLDSVPLVQSPHLINIMQRDYEATAGEWKNFTGTMAETVQQIFINACDTAYHQALSGMISRAQAVREAIEKVIEDGVKVRYPSGHEDTIETATARAVRTGISQASGHIQTARMDEFGVDLVLVSSHMGARPSHQVWQGKVYSRNGASEEYPNFVSSTGYGTVTGLCGANCRHNFSPWFEGMENPFEQYDSEENRKQYDIEQRQRNLERRIRNTKRETMNWQTAMEAETDPVKKAEYEAKHQKKAALLQKQNKAYNDFCKETGQKKRAERISIAKWDRSQAAKARAAAKKHKEGLENPQKSGKMKIDTGGRRNEKPLTDFQIAKAEESARKQGYTGEIFYRDTSSTSFHGSVDGKSFHYLVIGTDAYPAAKAKGAAVERVSLDGCMAHEVVGHYEAWAKGSTQSSVPLEEAQASIRASKFGIGLTDKEREILFEDAIERLQEAGLLYEDVKDSLDIWER